MDHLGKQSASTTADTDDTTDEVHETMNVGEACAASVTFQFLEPCPNDSVLTFMAYIYTVIYIYIYI